MPKDSAASALNTLTWEERYPSRNDARLADLSRWEKVVKDVASESKKNSTQTTSTKNSKK